MKKVIFILKSEAFMSLVAAIWVYYLVGASWWLFTFLLLFPDFFMVGYVKNSTFGAMLYNIGHTYITPSILLIIFLITNTAALLPISIIWFAHISMDRMLGYGLKFDTGFTDTHLGKIGRS